MNILKNYFLSTNKLYLMLPIALMVLAFLSHYFLVMSYQEELYKYHSEAVRNERLGSEYFIFKFNFIGYGVIYILQIIGVTLALNIGFLFNNLTFDFKKLSAVVMKSSIALVSIYIVVMVYYVLKNSVYTFEALYLVESKKFTLLYFFDELKTEWLRNVLEMMSVTQLLFVLFLALGVKYLLNCKYKKALVQVTKIYSIAFFICMCFVLILELNFYQ